MSIIHAELADCLRFWRRRLSPAEAGLPAGGHRRVPGLRREEVAQLAGVSVDYLARLEQGRASSPSASVLGSLARALRVSDAERAHLFRVAGQPEPAPGTINRHITPSLNRLLDRLHDVPVMVVDAAGEIVAANPLPTALLGDLSAASRRQRTLPWRHFTERSSRIVRTEAEQAAADAATVADLRDALGRFPNDEYLVALIEDLLRVSARFAQLWEQRPVARAPNPRKTFRHPEIGELTLEPRDLREHEPHPVAALVASPQFADGGLVDSSLVLGGDESLQSVRITHVGISWSRTVPDRDPCEPAREPNRRGRTKGEPTMITKLDFIAIPSRDSERSRRFYGETLGLRPDEHGQSEFWAGETCLSIWEPERLGMQFAPQKNGHLALQVDDVAAARDELERRGVTFAGDTFDTGVCHMAFFTDPDGNDLMLHHRYKSYE